MTTAVVAPCMHVFAAVIYNLFFLLLLLLFRQNIEDILDWYLVNMMLRMIRSGGYQY